MQFAELVLMARTESLRRGKADLVDLRNEGARAEKGVTKSMAGVSRSMDLVGAVAKRMAVAAAGAAAALVSVGAAVRAADTYQGTINGFRAMGQSADQAAASLDAVAAIAQRTRAPLEATASLYRRISVAAGELGASQQEVLRFTENVGLALAASGTGANEASGALLQLSQAMAGGVVRAEEFNSVLEGAFPIAQAAARGIDEAGGSVGRLRQLVVDGAISSEQFFDAILSQTGALEAAFGRTTVTMGQGLTNLGNGLTMLVGKLNVASGAGATVAGVLDALGDAAFMASAFITETMDTVVAAFDRVGVYAGVAAASLGVRYAGAAALAAARTVTLAGALGVLRTALIRTVIGGLVIGAGELAYQFSRLVKATGSFGDAMSMLGDVAGAVWQGIIDSAKAIPPALDGVWQLMKGGFVGALSDMAFQFAQFVNSMGARVAGIPGFDAFSSKLSEVSMSIDDIGVSLSNTAAEANGAAADAFANAAGKITDAFGPARDAVAALRGTVAETADTSEDGAAAADRLSEALAGGAGGGSGSGGTAKAAKDAAKEIEALQDRIQELEWNADPVKRYRAELEELNDLRGAGLSDGAYAKAVEDLNAELADSLPMVNDVADAWADWVTRGFQDFQSFAESVWSSFKNLLRDMIAAAARNQIMFSMGMTGGAGVGGIAQSVLGGGGGMLGGIGGAIGSIGGSLLGGAGIAASGLMSGGVGGMFSAIGAQVGTAAAMGTATSIAAAVGAVAAPIAGVALAAKALIGSTKVTDKGYGFEVTNGVVDPFKYTDKESSNIFGSSSSTDQMSLRAGPGRDNMLAQAQAAMGAVEAAAATLGIAETAFENFSTKVESSGRTAESVAQAAARLGEEYAELALTVGAGVDVVEKEVQGPFASIFGRMRGEAEETTRAYEQYVMEGETALDALARLATSLEVVNGTFAAMDYQLFAVSLAGADMASSLVQLMGGLEGFQNATSFYTANFYSDAEQLQIAANALHAEFARLNITTPQTMEAFRALVEAQDLTTTSGQETYAALMQIAPAFASVANAAAQAANTAAAAAGRANAAAGAAGSAAASAAATAMTVTIPGAGSVADAQSAYEKMMAEAAAAQAAAAKAAQTAARRAEAQRRAAEAARAAEQQALEAARAAQQVADERYGLETRYLQALGDTAALREREIAALAPANQAFGRMVIELEAAQKAAEALSESDFASRIDFQRARVAALNGANLNTAPGTTPFAPPASYSVPSVASMPAPASSSPAGLTVAEQRELLRLLTRIEQHTKDTARETADTNEILENDTIKVSNA